MNLTADLKDVSRDYGSGHTAVRALDEVSVHVESGEVVLVMGPSGSGKSTLLQVMGGMLRPTSGNVVVAGNDVTRLSNRALAHFHRLTVGFVYQTPNLLPALTARENVEIILNVSGVRGSRARSKAEELIASVGLAERADHLPAELSGGEQQRVGIARAIVNNPAIILADEPTASLDSRTGYAVAERLRSMAAENDTSVVVVTHDARIRGLADRILWLEDGRLRVQLDADASVADPVCQMVLDPADGHPSFDYDGKTYQFCSEECRQRFIAKPGAHLSHAR